MIFTFEMNPKLNYMANTTKGLMITWKIDQIHPNCNGDPLSEKEKEPMYNSGVP